MIDTHAHIFKEDYEDINFTVKEAIKNGVETIINCACSKDLIAEGIELVNIFDNMYLSIGFHPNDANVISLKDLNYLEEILINKNKKIISIGEIGLDYYYENINKEKQKQLFEEQLKLAVKYNLPVTIHTRNSIEDTYDILKRYPVKGVIHCFSGSLEMAKRFIALGYYLGIGGVITFKNAKINDIIKKIKLDKIVLETDSPYLSPLRGDKNSPKNIKIIAQFLAEENNLTIEQIEEITNKNVHDIYKI